MKQKSIKFNAILNMIKTLMGVIFPLITFPYASRILLPEGIGSVNFATSIISYFALFASLGINSYGVREGSKIRESRNELSIFAKELFTINIISTIVSYIFLGITIIFVPKLNEYKILLAICSISILFTTLGMEWLYTAVEDFVYITIRSIFFQFFSLVFLFICVHTSDDVLKYAFISIIANVGSNLFNFIHSRKYIDFNVKINFSSLRKHLQPVGILFIMTITSSIYTILDTSMLGFMTTDYQVGIYTAATKINRIVLNLIISTGTVLLPRLSYYCGKNDKKKFWGLAYKSFDLLMLLAVPAAIGLSVLTPDIISIISGVKYISAVPVMRIINPVIVIVGISNFIGVQIFMPLKKEKWTLYSDIAGACVNLLLNALLIRIYGAIGAAIASVCAELIVTYIQLYFIKKYLSLKVIFLKLIKYLIMAIIMGYVAYFVSRLFPSKVLSLILGVLSGIVIYVVELILTKDVWIKIIIQEIKGWIYVNKG